MKGKNLLNLSSFFQNLGFEILKMKSQEENISSRNFFFFGMKIIFEISFSKNIFSIT